MVMSDNSQDLPLRLHSPSARKVPLRPLRLRGLPRCQSVAPSGFSLPESAAPARSASPYARPLSARSSSKASSARGVVQHSGRIPRKELPPRPPDTHSASLPQAPRRRASTADIPEGPKSPLLTFLPPAELQTEERDLEQPRPINARSLLVMSDPLAAESEVPDLLRPRSQSDPSLANPSLEQISQSASCSSWTGAHSSSSQISAEDLSSRDRFTGEIRQSLLDGWEPQPSPCCAAASVAGAFNCIWEQGRSSTQRVSVLEVTALMAAFCQRRALVNQQKVERRLGATDGMLTPLLAAAEEVLQQRGFVWSAGRDNPCEVSTNMFSLALQEVLERMPRFSWVKGHAAHQMLRSALAGSLGRVKCRSRANSREAGGEMADLDAVAPAALSARSRPSRPMESPLPFGPEGTTEESVGACERGASAKVKRRMLSKGSPSCGKQSKGILRDLGKLFSKWRATRRLQGERPRTTDIGSWGVIQAAKDVARTHGCAESFKVSVFLGKQARGSKAATVPLSQHDGASKVNQQWEALKTSFRLPQCALLFHLRNHYALIFAWREWSDDGSTTLRRQVLTARKRQKPSAWIDFEEIRGTILGSTGYQILLLEVLLHAREPADAWHWPDDGSDMDDDVSSSGSENDI